MPDVFKSMNELSVLRPDYQNFALRYQRDRASSSGAALTPNIVVHPAQTLAETGSTSQPNHSRGRHHYRRRTTGLLTRSQPEGLPMMPNPPMILDANLSVPVSAWLMEGSYHPGDRLAHDGSIPSETPPISVAPLHLPQEPSSQSSGRHGCPDCRKGFDRLSELR